jgi:hypothetical protein
MDSPFLRPESVDYAEILTDATVHVLGARGIDRFSVRAIAAWMRVVPSTVLGEFSRARVLELVCICFEDRWLQWSSMESVWGPSPAAAPVRLPATEDEKLGVRVHDALLHLAAAEGLRGNCALKMHLDRLHQKELALLKLRMRSRCCSAEPSDAAAAAVLALATGLRVMLAHDHPGLTHPLSVDALADYVALMSSHSPECGSARLAS